MSSQHRTVAPLVLLILIAVLATVGIAAGRATGSAVAVAAPSPPPAFRPASTAPLPPETALVPHTNAYSGYSIKLPPAYRRAAVLVDADNTGRDIYTPRSAQEDQTICSRRPAGPPAPERVADVKVAVHANPNGVSPTSFASAAERRLALTSVVGTTIGGHEAAKVVHQPSGDTAYYVVAANGRLYEIAPMLFEQPTTQPAGWLDQIANTFSARAPQAEVPASTGPLCR